jgi:hypothetical protein
MTQPAGQTRPAQTGGSTSASAAEPAPAPRQAKIQALIDNATADRLYGWAWNAADPEQRLAIELRLGETTVAGTIADLARPDLADNGIGDGCHAFEFALRPEWIERRGELSAVVRCEDGAEVPVAVRIRRPDDAQIATHLQRAVERLAAEQAELRQDVAARPDPASGLRERLDQLELWVARLDARLGDGAAAPPTQAGTGAAGGGGLDPWQAALIAVLASASSAALALAIARALG